MEYQNENKKQIKLGTYDMYINLHEETPLIVLITEYQIENIRVSKQVHYNVHLHDYCLTPNSEIPGYIMARTIYIL